MKKKLYIFVILITMSVFITACSILTNSNSSSSSGSNVKVSTIAGSGATGSADGIGTVASFYNPTGVAVDSSSNIYVADTYNNKIRKIMPSTIGSTNSTGAASTTAGFIVTTLAGSGTAGSADGTGTAASFNFPFGIALDSSGNLYVADYGNSKIRMITPAGVVSTLAGTGIAGHSDGISNTASFNYPYGVAIDSSGNVYVADTYNYKIRKITSSGIVSTLAGSGIQSNIDGTGTAASFNYPFAVVVDSFNNIYVADYGNNLIRKITSAGVVSTLAGSGSAGSADGTGASASFNHPTGVALDSFNNIYVADYGNNLIRKINSAVDSTTNSGVVSTFAGSRTSPTFYSFGIAIDPYGIIYIADNYYNQIRKITH